MAVDIEHLTKAYFYFDLPVEYKLNEQTIKIYPISLKDSEIFLSSVSLLAIDKNSSPSVEIIQMSYLDFIIKFMLMSEHGEDAKQMLFNILSLCLHFSKPMISIVNEKFVIADEDSHIIINAKQFDDIKRIILYQNIKGYDDSYIDPDFKKSMMEQDELRRHNLAPLSIERKMAIITAHCGLSKQEQCKMTLRSFSVLFDEVVGEVEHIVKYPVAMYTGHTKDIEHWIYKPVKNKFDGYAVSTESYNKSMGGNGHIQQATSPNELLNNI